MTYYNSDYIPVSWIKKKLSEYDLEAQQLHSYTYPEDPTTCGSYIEYARYSEDMTYYLHCCHALGQLIKDWDAEHEYFYADNIRYPKHGRVNYIHEPARTLNAEDEIRDLKWAIESLENKVREYQDREARLYDLIDEILSKVEENRSEISYLHVRMNLDDICNVEESDDENAE